VTRSVGEECAGRWDAASRRGGCGSRVGQYPVLVEHNLGFVRVVSVSDRGGVTILFFLGFTCTHVEEYFIILISYQIT